LVLTQKQKIGLGVGAAAAAVVAGTVAVVAAKPSAPPTPSPGGEVEIIVKKLRYPKGVKYPLIPADVSVEIRGRALKGIPPPDMTLTCEWWRTETAAWAELFHAAIPAVELNTLQTTAPHLFSPADLKEDTTYDWGDWKVRGKLELENVIGYWGPPETGSLSSETPFMMGRIPHGPSPSVFPPLEPSYPAHVTATGTVSTGDLAPIPDAEMSLLIEKLVAGTWVTAARTDFGAVPAGTTKTIFLDDTEGGEWTTRAMTILTNPLGAVSPLSATATYLCGEAPVGEIEVPPPAKSWGKTAQCKICGAPLKVTLPKTRCAKCGSTYRVKAR